MSVDVELGGLPEVALAPGREADVRADARNSERAGRVPVEVVSHDVPDALVEPERVGIEPPLGLALARGRPVSELDRPLLRDRGLELREARGELRRVVGRGHPDALGGRRRRVAETGTPERKILQREAQRLGVRELSLERVERGLQRRELVLLQVELVEEVVLRAERVQLLAGELVPLGLERHAERGQLGAIRVEPPREGLVRHLRVALDVSLHVACGERSPLGHQERHK